MESNDITRRQVVATLGGAVGLAGCTGGSGNESGGNGSGGGDDNAGGGGGGSGGSSGSGGGNSGTVKISVLQPLTGDLKYYGQQALWGFYEGFNHKSDEGFTADAKTGTKTATVGGIDYELLVRDTQLKAGRAQSLATDLVQNESVDMLFGCSSSSTASRVATTITKQAGIPTMLGPAASAGITSSGETCSESLFRAARTPRWSPGRAENTSPKTATSRKCICSARTTVSARRS